MSAVVEIGRGRLTEADKARIHELAAKGWKCTRIAKEIGRHSATVNWFMYSEGLQAPQYNPNRPKTYVRKGRIVHLFSKDEDVFIETLRIQNFDFQTIAKAASNRFNTQRSAHVIKCRLIMLAAREDSES